MSANEPEAYGALRTPFGATADGTRVERLSLTAGDLSVSVLTLGAILQDVRLAGTAHGLTLGSPDPDAYRDHLALFGPIVGPVANRIGGASALIEGQPHHFEANQGGRHTLHSGTAGLHRKVWSVEEASSRHVRLGLTLADGDGGLPGLRRLTATWSLSPPATLDLVLEAETTASTLLNLAHHPYWNLDGSETWAGHSLRIQADRYLPVDAHSLPTGEVAPVAGSPFDLQRETEPPNPIDNNFCLSDARRPLTSAARLRGRLGVVLDIFTTEPGLQLYDGGAAAAPGVAGHDGRIYGPYSGLALEPQFWPDAPHNPNFPSILLRPGTPWRHHTRYSFSR